MMKLSYILIVTLVAFVLVFAGCDSAGADGGGGDKAELLDLENLDLSATVTHTFDPDTQTWAEDFDHEPYTGPYYALINTTEGGEPTEDDIIDRDPESDAATSNSFSLSTGVPAEGDMLTATDWGYPDSSPANVKLYSARVGMGVGSGGGHDIGEGNYDVSNDYVEYYEYIYAAEACTLSGTVEDADGKYTMNNVQLSKGWNAIITRTENGDDFDYYGGTIAGAEWTLME